MQRTACDFNIESMPLMKINEFATNIFLNKIIDLNVFGTRDFFFFVIKLINACSFPIKG